MEPVDDKTLLYHFANAKAAQTIQSLSGGKPFTIGSNSSEIISFSSPRDIIQGIWASPMITSECGSMLSAIILSLTCTILSLENGSELSVDPSALTGKKEVGSGNRTADTLRYSCVATTVTHLKSLEEELRKNQEHLEQMVQVRTQELNCALEVKSRFREWKFRGDFD